MAEADKGMHVVRSKVEDVRQRFLRLFQAAELTKAVGALDMGAEMAWVDRHGALEIG